LVEGAQGIPRLCVRWKLSLDDAVEGTSLVVEQVAAGVSETGQRLVVREDQDGRAIYGDVLSQQLART
jgi:hypothetical protein